LNDPDWGASGGDGTNPFAHSTLFETVFTPYPGITGQTMMKLVKGGGASDPAQKAARNLVAAYLNVAYGLDLDGLTLLELRNMWTDATISGDFLSLHNYLGGLNARNCPIR
jgi:hypothetical protein